ncbi:arginase [Phascolomyces articulosus]|uniref:Arginase n=1 Tax=Phascolomyces articulosus TaxID=60185 RepID=A0AAD5P8V6_9FUNG|nr:arginase [Phascolomyces articulosus]
MPVNATTIIFSPYHVGIRDHRVENGPHRIYSLGIVQELERLEIEPGDKFEGEIDRSFEILPRTFKAVHASVERGTFPLVLSDNYMVTVGAACGLDIKDPGFIYFDAHDDLDSPDHPFNYNRFIYVGLRDQSNIQRQRVIDAEMTCIWGNPNQKVNFLSELYIQLTQKNYSAALVHLDLDSLNDFYGKVNGFPYPRGLFEDNLLACINLVPKKRAPVSLTAYGDKIAKIAIRAISAFVQSLFDTGVLAKH